MLMDYDETHKVYLIRVPRQDAGTIRALMTEHGLDLSIPLSTPQEACLFTREPYAAVTFIEHATPGAQSQLSTLFTAIAASWDASPSASPFALPASMMKNSPASKNWRSKPFRATGPLSIVVQKQVSFCGPGQAMTTVVAASRFASQ